MIVTMPSQSIGDPSSVEPSDEKASESTRGQRAARRSVDRVSSPTAYTSILFPKDRANTLLVGENVKTCGASLSVIVWICLTSSLESLLYRFTTGARRFLGKAAGWKRRLILSQSYLLFDSA